MTEYVLLALSWYAIGLISMLLVQCWIDKETVSERKMYPGHKPSHEVGAQEIWVLGLAGPFIAAALIYFTVLLWWITKNEVENHEKKRR